MSANTYRDMPSGGENSFTQTDLDMGFSCSHVGDNLYSQHTSYNTTLVDPSRSSRVESLMEQLEERRNTERDIHTRYDKFCDRCKDGNTKPNGNSIFCQRSNLRKQLEIERGNMITAVAYADNFVNEDYARYGGVNTNIDKKRKWANSEDVDSWVHEQLDDPSRQDVAYHQLDVNKDEAKVNFSGMGVDNLAFMNVASEYGFDQAEAATGKNESAYKKMYGEIGSPSEGHVTYETPGRNNSKVSTHRMNIQTANAVGVHGTRFHGLTDDESTDFQEAFNKIVVENTTQDEVRTY